MPPRATLPAASGVGLENSKMALPAVEAPSSVSDAPLRAPFAVAAVIDSTAASYVSVKVALVTPAAWLRVMGMPLVVLLVTLMLWPASGPREKSGIDTTAALAGMTTVDVV